MNISLPLLRRWLDEESVVYECRECGTTLDDPESACPYCGSGETVEYRLE